MPDTMRTAEPETPATEPVTATTPTGASEPNARKRLLTYLAGGVAVAAVAFGGYEVAIGSHHVSTDNAYVGAQTAEVTPLVSGPVAKVLVNDTETVKAGQTLVVLDDSDARISVAMAEAAYAEAQRKVQGYFANDGALEGQVAAHKADIQHAQALVVSAQSDIERAKTDLDRRVALQPTGAVSDEELTAARNRYQQAVAALASAQAGLAQARAGLSAASGQKDVNAALIQGGDVEENPEVLAAKARLDAARLALSRTVLKAPTDGVVSRKNVEVGQQVQIGQSLMVIVPLQSAYVDANFKEVQLKNVKPGQPVTLTSDLYGSHVKYRGTVVGFSGGTGAAFSLIPAQNASGNWIKVVQRLPVRISVDPEDLEAHPLRVGLSMKATIDISGKGTPAPSPNEPVQQAER